MAASNIYSCAHGCTRERSGARARVMLSSREIDAPSIRPYYLRVERAQYDVVTWYSPATSAAESAVSVEVKVVGEARAFKYV